MVRLAASTARHWPLAGRMAPVCFLADSPEWAARIAGQDPAFGVRRLLPFARSGKSLQRTAALPGETPGAKDPGPC